MHLFHKRHLALFCALFAAACICGCFLYATQKLILGLSALLLGALFLILVLAIRKYRARLLKIALCILFVSLSLLESYWLIDRERNKWEPFIDTTINAEIIVQNTNVSSEFYSSFDVFIIWEGQKHAALLECHYPCEFSAGDILRGDIFVESIEENRENANYYLARGAYVSVQSQENNLTVIDSGYSDFKTKIRSLNRRFALILEREIGGDAADLASAVSLGNKSFLENHILRDFRRTGLSHVLAISGMHLSVLMMALEALLRRLGVKKEARCLLIFSFCLFYLALTGFSLSTVRAFIMMSFVYLAFLLRKDNDAVTSLFCSLFLILFLSPHAVWDIGLWLSFLAVLGILTADYFIKNISDTIYKSKIPKVFIKPVLYVISAILITLFANIFVCFPMWLYFEELSLISVLSNLIISPLISLFLGGSLLFLLVYLTPILTCSTPFLAFLLRVLSDLILWIVSQMSHWEGITVSLRYPFAGLVIVPSAILLFVALVLRLKQKRWIPVIPTVGALVFCGLLLTHNLSNANSVTIDHLSYNESEMMLLTTTKDSVIFDLSTGSNSYLYQTIRHSKNRFSTEISAVVLTHYHNYHISTFSRNAASTMIRTLYMPVPQSKDEYHIMCSLIDVSKKAKCHVVLYDRGKDFSLSENITFNLSNIAYLPRSTHPTFALSISAFEETLTYVAESAHEDNFLLNDVNKRLQSSDYIIFGTHGPITKTDFTYEGLTPSQYIFIANPNVQAHFKPKENSHIIVNSSQNTIRIKS